MKFRIAKLIALWFGAGLFPKVPGTAGTMAALPFAWLMQVYAPAWVLPVAVFLIFLTGCWASAVYVQQTGKEDPSEVVIDEVAGIWLVLCFFEATPLNYIMAFLAFRVFDMVKPWPVSLADRKVKGGFGVMLDDLLASAYAILTLHLIYSFI